MPGRVEDKFLDVLQNIEFAIVGVYKLHPDMVDYDAQDAVSALLRVYQSELRKSAPPTLKLSPLAQETFEQLKSMCDWRLGRAKPEGFNRQKFGSHITPIALADMVDCLKRIRRSIEMWNKEGGRRGYYEFVKEFVK